MRYSSAVHVIVGTGSEVTGLKQHRLGRLDISHPLRGLPGALLPFLLQRQMYLFTIFVLPFLLAGQGMTHCVLTKCSIVTYGYPRSCGLGHRHWCTCRQRFGQ
jgi:hypothetical protein